MELKLNDNCRQQITKVYPNPRSDERLLIDRLSSNRIHFHDVFFPNDNNYTVAKYMVLENLLKNQNLMMVTFGYSGTGKTYSLFGSKGDEAKKIPAKLGILAETMRNIVGAKNFRIGAFEIYGVGMPFYDYWVSDNIQNNNYYYLIHRHSPTNLEVNKSPGSYPVNSLESEFYGNESKYFVSFDGTSKIVMPELNKSITYQRFRENRIMATLNNPESSRSGIFYHIKFDINSTTRSFIIVDLPGKENPMTSYVNKNKHFKYLPLNEEVNLIETITEPQRRGRFRESKRYEKEVTYTYNIACTLKNGSHIHQNSQKAIVAACLINPLFLLKLIPEDIIIKFGNICNAVDGEGKNPSSALNIIWYLMQDYENLKTKLFMFLALILNTYLRIPHEEYDNNALKLNEIRSYAEIPKRKQTIMHHMYRIRSDVANDMNFRYFDQKIYDMIRNKYTDLTSYDFDINTIFSNWYNTPRLRTTNGYNIIHSNMINIQQLNNPIKLNKNNYESLKKSVDDLKEIRVDARNNTINHYINILKPLLPYILMAVNENQKPADKKTILQKGSEPIRLFNINVNSNSDALQIYWEMEKTIEYGEDIEENIDKSYVKDKLTFIIDNIITPAYESYYINELINGLSRRLKHMEKIRDELSESEPIKIKDLYNLTQQSFEKYSELISAIQKSIDNNKIFNKENMVIDQSLSSLLGEEIPADRKIEKIKMLYLVSHYTSETGNITNNCAGQVNLLAQNKSFIDTIVCNNGGCN